MNICNSLNLKMSKKEKCNNRYDFIDNAKGIALLFVISWHCYFSIFPQPIYTEWVLPFFFIVMGCFYKHNLTIREIIAKKANGLLIPWIIFSIPAIVLAAIGIKGFDINKVYDPYSCILGPCWFLICMFWAYIIYWGLNEMIRQFTSKHQSIWLMFACGLVTTISWSMNYISIANHRALFPLFLSAAFTCIIFVGIGQLQKNIILNTPLFSLKNLFIVMAFIMVIYISVFFGANKPFNPMWNETDQPVVLAFICAIAGSYIAIQLSRVIPSFFCWIGRNTIPLLCIHYYPTQLLLNYYPEMGAMLRYIIVLIISLPLTYLASQCFPVVNGKGQLIKI